MQARPALLKLLSLAMSFQRTDSFVKYRSCSAIRFSSAKFFGIVAAAVSSV
jgi:hypothetical protein